MIKIINNFLSLFKVNLIRVKNLEKIKSSRVEYELSYTTLKQDFELIKSKLTSENLKMVADIYPNSKSQLKQDVFVLLCNNFKKKGYFVEFGATNGISLSNTHMLETKFHWQGILAEPCKHWHENLFQNRNCHIDTKCVFRESNLKLVFNEAKSPEFSTLKPFETSDHNARIRKSSYEVDTISLNDLLEKYNAPENIDYLSIDTEGSEYEIIKNLDFDKYSFTVITVEHNFTKQRDSILSLLERNGYKRVLTNFSKWDDWYIKS